MWNARYQIVIIPLELSNRRAGLQPLMTLQKPEPVTAPPMTERLETSTSYVEVPHSWKKSVQAPVEPSIMPTDVHPDTLLTSLGPITGDDVFV